MKGKLRDADHWTGREIWGHCDIWMGWEGVHVKRGVDGQERGSAMEVVEMQEYVPSK